MNFSHHHLPLPLLLLQLVTRTKKIFVGGLSVNTTIEDVKHYFDQFGKVSDLVESASLCSSVSSVQCFLVSDSHAGPMNYSTLLSKISPDSVTKTLR